VTRNDDEWELEIAAPNKPGSYSGVCWDLNPLAVDETVFNHLVIEVRAVSAPSRAHIKMERPNLTPPSYGLMRVAISDPGDLRLNLAGFRRALPRLGRFCVQSLPGSGSSPRTSFTLGRVYLSE
jgi:hypothetical protein